VNPKTPNSEFRIPNSGDPHAGAPTPNSYSGVGIDIVEVKRVERAVEVHGQRFLDRLFTPKELDYARGKKRAAETLAGRFAAKEAFMKALGARLTFREIEILERSGRPFVLFRGEEYPGVSISHERAYAVAVMVLCNEGVS
jgi:holo-[acyl-carrier protein] synthase